MRKIQETEVFCGRCKNFFLGNSPLSDKCYSTENVGYKPSDNYYRYGVLKIFFNNHPQDINEHLDCPYFVEKRRYKWWRFWK